MVVWRGRTGARRRLEQSHGGRYAVGLRKGARLPLHSDYGYTNQPHRDRVLLGMARMRNHMHP